MGWCEGWDANVDGAATGTLIDLTDTLTGADAVFGGHTHQQFASMVLGRPVVQVPNSGQMYSRVIIRLDTVSGAPVGSSVDFVTKAALTGVAPDPATPALVAEYRAALAAKLDVIVGTVTGVLPRGGTPPVERSGEAPMGDFAADAVRSKYCTDFALLNGGGIRDLLPGNGYQPLNPGLRRPTPGSTGPYDVTLGGDGYAGAFSPETAVMRDLYIDQGVIAAHLFAIADSAPGSFGDLLVTQFTVIASPSPGSIVMDALLVVASLWTISTAVAMLMHGLRRGYGIANPAADRHHLRGDPRLRTQPGPPRTRHGSGLPLVKAPTRRGLFRCRPDAHPNPVGARRISLAKRIHCLRHNLRTRHVHARRVARGLRNPSRNVHQPEGPAASRS